MKNRVLSMVMLALALLAPSSASAESAKLNLHIEPGILAALTGIAEGGRQPIGPGGWVSVDYQLRPPIALEVITGVGGLTTGNDWTVYGTFGAGVRLRFMDNQEGYMNDPGGDTLGNLWVSAHLGYHRLDGNQFGFDAAVGYEWSLIRPLQVGVFVRGVLAVGGRNSGVDGIVSVGVSASFELLGEVDSVDSDNDSLSDEREVNRWHTQPTNPDTDDDQLEDGVEVRTDTNPLVADTDGDTLIDGREDANGNGSVDAGESNPRVADTDSGGVPDGFEVTDGTNPTDRSDDDRDHDGVPNDRDECRDTAAGTEVDERGCAIIRERMTLPGITFELDSAEIRPESENTLNMALSILRDNPEAQVEIGGHTDNRGARAHNTTLSRQRAAAVKAWLVAHGIAAGRMTTRGYGPDRPVGSNDTEEGQAQNRRIEFTHTNFED